MNDLLHRAEQFATRAHAGQVDKAGKPYIDHCRRVAAKCRSEEAKVVAWLHDVVEDGADWDEVLNQFGYNTAWAVGALSRPRSQGYIDYIWDCRLRPITREVKIADLRDNMDLSRLPCITMQDLMRQAKYMKALRILTS